MSPFGRGLPPTVTPDSRRNHDSSPAGVATALYAFSTGAVVLIRNLNSLQLLLITFFLQGYAPPPLTPLSKMENFPRPAPPPPQNLSTLSQKKAAGEARRQKPYVIYNTTQLHMTTQLYMISRSFNPSGVATSNVPCVYFSSCWLASRPSSSSSWLTRSGTMKFTTLKIP